MSKLQTENKVMQLGCKFCSTDESRIKHDIWDVRIYETENFVVTPTLGSLIPGWLLIYPKNHYLNFSEIPSEYDEELNDVIEHMSIKLENEFGEVTIFEHGPYELATKLGCGVDHAHLHLVSLPFDLLEIVKDDFKYCWERNFGLHELSLSEYGDAGYYYISRGRDSYSAKIKKGMEVSQYFRKLISAKLGCTEKYDYKKYSFKENALLTVDRLLEEMLEDVV